MQNIESVIMVSFSVIYLHAGYLYLSIFATWIIDKKNSENTMTTWDDRYNTEKQYNAGINNYSSNGLNSRIKDKIHNIYEGDTYTDDVKAYFINKESCIGKRSINELENTGIYECAVKSESYPISILALYEYFFIII